MARIAKGGLNKHPSKGYRLTIGKKANGKPREFWLGHDRRIAEFHASALRTVMTDQMKPAGRDVWTDQDLDAVKWMLGYWTRSMREAIQTHAANRRALATPHPEDVAAVEEEANEIREIYGIDPADAESLAPLPATAPATASAAPMLHATIDTYVKGFEAKGDKAASTKARLREVFEVVKKAHADIEIRRIDRLWIDQMAQHWKNRPAHKKTKKPISTYTVKTVLRHLSAFFGWLSDNEDTTGFIEPKKMAKLFKYRPAEIDEIDQLTLPEIKALYAAGTDWHRALLLMGITCGQTQQELAAATADEFDFEQSVWTHRRSKTGVKGSHWLCPELVALLKARIRETPKNEGKLAFLTRDGRPLVVYRDGAKVSDAVKQAWDDLLEKVAKKVKLKRRPTYKLCRKFLGDWLKNNYGEELAQVGLQHKPQSVLSKHYATGRRNFEPLHEAQRALYAQLVEAKVFEVERAAA